ncbi:hypothetical protein ACFSOZ_11160 [Mesorhizobium newzealandense]|uniref:Uncharacterized protein n=1 Tax=Mesorhizobium newzealandense TaxID=1300302 RepID=A0ABW4UAV2_9HYPH
MQDKAVDPEMSAQFTLNIAELDPPRSAATNRPLGPKLQWGDYEIACGSEGVSASSSRYRLTADGLKIVADHSRVGKQFQKCNDGALVAPPNLQLDKAEGPVANSDEIDLSNSCIRTCSLQGELIVNDL